MLRLLFITFFFLTPIYGKSLDTPDLIEGRKREEEQILKRFKKIAELFKKVEGKQLLEITEHLLASEDVTREIKEKIYCQQRRIFLFEYPSDGMLIKGYISFVPNAEKQPLLVFLRGGNRNFGLLPPHSRFSFFGNYNVIATTYRGGINPGIDEYGGADVADVKHLVDFIPHLEKKLGLCFSQNKKYILGGSRGGLQMFLTLSRYHELQTYFDKAISLSGRCDLNEALSTRKEFINYFQKEFGYDGSKQWISRRNPIDHVSKIRKDFPILNVQGTSDNRVSVDDGYKMLEALKSTGHSPDYLEFEGGNHCLRNVPTLFDELIAWLEAPSL